MASSDVIEARAFPALLSGRLAIGLAQGVLLWLLVHAAQTQPWPTLAFIAEPHVFVPLFAVVALVPVAALAGLGNLRPLPLLLWLACAAALIAIVENHQVWRHQQWGVGLAGFESGGTIVATLALAAALFIAHTLVVAGGADRRPIAAYRTYFDTAWKHQLQLVLSLAFVGAFWGVLFLGAALFQLIGLGLVRELIAQPWFAIPASTLVFAAAVHVTDVRAGLVQGMKNLLHGLLSWLLPVATGLIVAFLAALPFAGLAPLWRTSYGSAIVLAAAALLVLLINTVYRDGGDPDQPRILRWGGTAAALCLPVLVAISAYGLALRIGHRGLTNDRVIGIACVIVAGCFAIGYAWAAVASRPWMKRLEATNLIAAGLIFAAIVALTTPIADPARLAVGDQVARLRDGRVSPAEFDFKYLRFDAARYGREALERLKTAEGANAEAIRRGAERAAAMTNRYAQEPAPTAADIDAIAVFPPGQALPQSFARQSWRGDPHYYQLPGCLTTRAAANCEAHIVDDGSGSGPTVLLLELDAGQRGVLLRQDADAVWQLIGSLSQEVRCAGVRDALRAGDYRWVVPRRMEVEAAGQRLAITPPGRPVTCK